MDEGLLNDLLECSVCLERLDTSSRVLPCQHTFCLKCLKEIVESHKELRCPECRVLVEARVDELPPNVLLMRILEGMRNAPRKLSAPGRDRPNKCSYSQQLLQVHGHVARVGDVKQLPPHGRAMYDYLSKEPGDLSFKKGELIVLQKRMDPFWYQGECSGRSGVFPITYVQVMVPLPMPSALCKALYDFRMSAPDEEGCLAFDKGAIISVHRRVDENWAEGRLDERVGIFPIAFVELNQAARQLMNSATQNRPVPPIPEPVRPGHSDQRHPQAQHTLRYQQMSLSTPATVQQVTYQNMATMSQSHPHYRTATQSQASVPQSVQSHGGLVTTTAVPRNILEPTHNKTLDLIHFTNTNTNINIQNKAGVFTVGLQSVGARINEGCESRLRSVKYECYNSTPLHHRADATYQNVRVEPQCPSSDSSGGSGSTTTPNTSSDTSESAEPSLPSSPEDVNNTAVTVHVAEQDEQNDAENSLNTSMGVLSLNESSTATNTSLNVTLPAENSALNASGSSSSASQNPNGTPDSPQLPTEQARSDATPSFSKSQPAQSGLRANGPDSLLNFGLGLQAALSPSHGKDSSYMGSRSHREQHHREKEKRNSLTQATHLQANPHLSQNRHSAEIVATSLLDHAPERERDNRCGERERERDRERGFERDTRGARERERRRRRSRSNERPLPAPYMALYPYRPQKGDELELKKGGVYMVMEKCRDGWYKGCSDRTQRCGVFPGNYVTPASSTRPKPDKVVNSSTAAYKPAVDSAPDAPPRALTPPPHVHLTSPPTIFPWTASMVAHQTSSRIDKSKEKLKQEKTSISSGVSLMKRLAAMKKCKSPPPVGYSMDNPVFEDGPGTSLMLNLPSTVQPPLHPLHPVHVRSGSCPSQLLRSLPGGGGTGGGGSGGGSHRVRGKERALLPMLVQDVHARHANRSVESPWQTQHRKSQSLDVTVARRDKHHTQPVKERFRCVVPYPPNSEYELELRLDDIVMVHRKRGDGWYKGTLQRTGRTGLFPASFVQSCPNH